MPLPSEANLRTVIGKTIKLFQETLEYGSSNTPNFVTMQADVLDEVPTDSAPGTQDALAGLRANLAAMIGSGQVQACLAAMWVTYGRVKLYPQTQVAAILGRLLEDFGAAGTTVQSRNFTFATFAAGGSNVGSGAMTRLTKDLYNYNIEGQYVAEAMTVLCIQDANSGAQLNQEVFQFRGSAAGPDDLDRTGSGLTGPIITALTAEAGPGSQFITNGGFESGTFPIASNTGLTGWTFADYTDFATETTTVYKSKLATGVTSRALSFVDNGSVSQTWNSRGGIRWDPAVPMYAQIAFNRVSSCDGTLTVTIGGKTMSVALVAQSGWTILRWPLDYDSWIRRWDTTPYTGGVTIALASRTTGSLLVDDFIIAPYTQLGPGGTWAVIASGATPFLRGDTFAGTDSGGTSGIIQTWLARGYARYLPSTTGAPTWADPS